MAMRPASIAAMTSTTIVIGRRRARDTKFTSAFSCWTVQHIMTCASP
jgi:hypothetical protein